MTPDELCRRKIVPVIQLTDPAQALPLAEALLAGGIDVMEITLRSDAALPAIHTVSESLPEMTVGAGTILTPEQLTQARDAGSQFGVAPGLNPRVVEAARAADLLFIPGVATASEVEQALELGCRLQKFFPAGPLGGIPMLKALAGPYRHTGVQFIPLGGVTPDQLGDYLALDVVGAVGGSWLAPASALAAGDWATITRLARDAVAITAKRP